MSIKDHARMCPCPDCVRYWSGRKTKCRHCRLDLPGPDDCKCLPPGEESEKNALSASLRATEEALAVAEKLLEAIARGDGSDKTPAAQLVMIRTAATHALSALKNKPSLERVRVAREKVVEDADKWEMLRSANPRDDEKFKDQVFNLGLSVVRFRAALRDAGMVP